MTKTKEGIPDHYKAWATARAEKEYPKADYSGLEPRYRDHANMTHALIGIQRKAYEAALLRMWPLVDALQRIAVVMPEVMPDDQHVVVLGRVIATSREALSSLNIPQT